MKDKAKDILAVFFNEPTRHWPFTEILKKANISKPQATQWLKKFVKTGLIQRMKPENKMPYYIANYQNPTFQMKKRIFALEQLESSGLLAHLASLHKAKAAILFGSMTSWDWYTDSDIDIFIYGDDTGLETAPYEKQLHREIQVFTCKNEMDLKKFNPALLKNILRGYRIRGEIPNA